MAEKRRYTVTIPDHVASRIEANAKIVSASPTEYVADVVRWWFGQGCPPVTPDEQRLRGTVDVWNLDPVASYILENDDVVTGIMRRLGIPNLFAPLVEHDICHSFVAFDNHPTHWLVLHLWKGGQHKSENGLAFEAIPKLSCSKEQMYAKLRETASEMETKMPIRFSQLPTIPEAASSGITTNPASATPSPN